MDDNITQELQQKGDYILVGADIEYRKQAVLGECRMFITQPNSGPFALVLVVMRISINGLP